MSRQATRQVARTGFSARLFEVRTAAGLTQEQAAHRLGVTLRTYHRWEANDGGPRGEQLARLCILFGKPAEWFYADGEQAA
jgi:transcriptional regulator with XRE-family HTH domain